MRRPTASTARRSAGSASPGARASPAASPRRATPIAVEDVTVDDAIRVGPRLRHRGAGRDAVGAARLARHGGRRPQRPDPRDARRSTTGEIAFLRTIAALLAGIVEKGRLTAEVEARLAELTALDAARAELLSVVTHELRTPLSVVRVYVDLLAEAAAGRGRPDAGDAAEWRRRRARPARPARPAGRFDPRVRPRRGPDRAVARAVRRGRGGRRDGRDAAAPPAAAPDPLGPAARADDRDRRRDALPPGPRAAARERVEVRADRPTGVSIGVVAGRRRDPGLRHRRRPGRPARGLGERLRAVRPDRGPRPQSRLGDRPVRRASADDRDGRPHLPRTQRVRVGSRFVVALPAAGLTRVAGAAIYRATIYTSRGAPDGESATSALRYRPRPDVVAHWRFGEILRDIARGGLAGLVVGVVVGGPGARIAMRLIAAAHPLGGWILDGERQPDRRHHPGGQRRV